MLDKTKIKTFNTNKNSFDYVQKITSCRVGCL